MRDVGVGSAALGSGLRIVSTLHPGIAGPGRRSEDSLRNIRVVPYPESRSCRRSDLVYRIRKMLRCGRAPPGLIAGIVPRPTCETESMAVPTYIDRLVVEEGFLDGLDLEFEPGLNVLVGPRGVGKTTVIQLIRFGLGAGAFNKRYERASLESREERAGPRWSRVGAPADRW